MHTIIIIDIVNYPRFLKNLRFGLSIYVFFFFSFFLGGATNERKIHCKEEHNISIYVWHGLILFLSFLREGKSTWRKFLMYVKGTLYSWLSLLKRMNGYSTIKVQHTYFTWLSKELWSYVQKTNFMVLILDLPKDMFHVPFVCPNFKERVSSQV